jgi:hypothetical protein
MRWSVGRALWAEDEAEGTDRPFSLSSLSLIVLLSRLNSRFDFALSTSTMRFWRCHRRQLRFSRRWPCSRKLATFVQTYTRW